MGRKKRESNPSPVLVLGQPSQEEQPPEEAHPKRRKKPVPARKMPYWQQLLYVTYAGMRDMGGILSTMAIYMNLVILYAVGMKRAVPGSVTLAFLLLLLLQFGGMLVGLKPRRAKNGGGG